MKQIIIAASLLINMSSCTGVAGWFGSNTDSSELAAGTRDLSITKENAYSDLFLDSASLESFIEKEKLEADKAQLMRNFYAHRNYQFAWFASGGPTEQARGFWGLYASNWGAEKGLDEKLKQTMDSLVTQPAAGNYFSTSAHAAYADSTAGAGQASTSGANSSAAATIHQQHQSAGTATSTAGSKPVDSGSVAGASLSNTAISFSSSDSTLVQTELKLTKALIDYASVENGIVTTQNIFALVPTKKMRSLEWADSLLKRNDSAIVQANPFYNALKQKLAIYLQAARNGGWQPIAMSSGLKKGSNSPAVAALKKRLQATQDYPASDTTSLFNDSLAAAVKQVQQSLGLKATGEVNDSLIAALNVSAEERIQQIVLNMNRALWMPPLQDSSWVEINIPAQVLYAYRGMNKVLEMPVIVGDEATGTLAFSGRITQVVFNPDWKIPRSIVEKEILPALKNDPNYLQKRNMEIVSQNAGGVPEIRQKPGKENALGRVKFIFPNSHEFYLHDTPDKSLFQKNDRTLSHGCIRVADALALAQFVLDSASWPANKIRQTIEAGKEETISVSNPKPVHINYLTAWVDANGRLHFRNDVYGHDRQAVAMMFNKSGLQHNMATAPNADSINLNTTTP